MYAHSRRGLHKLIASEPCLQQIFKTSWKKNCLVSQCLYSHLYKSSFTFAIAKWKKKTNNPIQNVLGIPSYHELMIIFTPIGPCLWRGGKDDRRKREKCKRFWVDQPVKVSHHGCYIWLQAQTLSDADLTNTRGERSDLNRHPSYLANVELKRNRFERRTWSWSRIFPSLARIIEISTCKC